MTPKTTADTKRPPTMRPEMTKPTGRSSLKKGELHAPISARVVVGLLMVKKLNIFLAVRRGRTGSAHLLVLEGASTGSEALISTIPPLLTLIYLRRRPRRPPRPCPVTFAAARIVAPRMAETSSPPIIKPATTPTKTKREEKSSLLQTLMSASVVVADGTVKSGAA